MCKKKCIVYDMAITRGQMTKQVEGQLRGARKKIGRAHV